MIVHFEHIEQNLTEQLKGVDGAQQYLDGILTEGVKKALDTYDGGRFGWYDDLSCDIVKYEYQYDRMSYEQGILDILVKGQYVPDRTGVGTISFFDPMRMSRSIDFDCDPTVPFNVPMNSRKFIHIPSVLHETVWMLNGDTNIKYLNENKVRIWNEWADENGNLGPTYGFQWRHWPKHGGGEVDQLKEVIEGLSQRSRSRRLKISGWNVGMLHMMNLPPCHFDMTFNYTRRNGQDYVNLSAKQRSVDMFLGDPFNDIQYTQILAYVAAAAGMHMGTLTRYLEDTHIYVNHLPAVAELIVTPPCFTDPNWKPCTMFVDASGDFVKGTVPDIIKAEWFVYDNIDNGRPRIKAQVAV